MGSNRVFGRAVRASFVLLISALVFGLCSLSQSTPAFADYTTGSLVVQDGGNGKALSRDMVKEVTAQEVDGTWKITPGSFVLKDGETPLEQNTHFTASVSGPASDGLYTATITGKSPYSGTLTLYYIVGDDHQAHEKRKITDSSIVLNETQFVSDGQAHAPSVSVVIDGDTMDSENYTVDMPLDCKANGSYEVTVTGKENCFGTGKSSFVIGDSIQSATVTIENKTYTGSAISLTESDIKVQFINEGTTQTLTFNTDYTIEYENNVNAGTAKAIIKGKGKTANGYYVGKVEKQFTIEPYDLSSSSTYLYASFPNQTFTGSALTPDPSSTVYAYIPNSTTLTKGKDYDLTYSNNVNAGTATATFNGKGNFKGKTSKTFTINSAYMSSTTVGAIAARTYTGSQLKPSVSGVKLGSYALQGGRDYTLSYGTNKNAGTSAGSVTLTGKGNFTSTKTAYFDINAKSITSSDISVTGISNYSYTGSAITPSPTITDKTRNAKLAVYDSSKVAYLIGNNYYDSKYNVLYFDYETAYANNTNPGTATLTITGMGNYTGTRKVNFTINGTGTVPQVKATNKGNGQVSLEWGHIYNATKYMIQEKLPNGKYKTLSNSWTRNRCTITNLSATRNHRFLVRAFVDNKWSSNSDKHLVSIKPTGATKPTVRMYSAGKKAITLAWNAVPGTDRYAIYEKVGGQFQLLTSSYTSTTVTINKLKKKGKYTFAIRAYIDGKWSKVKKKDYVTVSPADPNPPTVTAVGGVGAGKVRLTWDKARNAKKYMVQVKLENGKWKTLTKKLKKRTYTASGLSSNREHTFRVRAYGNKKWSKTYSECYASATPDNA